MREALNIWLNYHPDLGDLIGALGVLHILPGAYFFIKGVTNKIIDAKIFGKTVGTTAMTIGTACVVFSGLYKSHILIIGPKTRLIGLLTLLALWFTVWARAKSYLKKRKTN